MLFPAVGGIEYDEYYPVNRLLNKVCYGALVKNELDENFRPTRIIVFKKTFTIMDMSFPSTYSVFSWFNPMSWKGKAPFG